MFGFFKSNAKINPITQTNIKTPNRIINLVGDKHHVKIASKQISEIFKNLNKNVKIISISPTISSTNSIEDVSEWRFKLSKELKSNTNILINEIGESNCEDITDFTRTIRQMSLFIHPYVLIVDPNASDLNQLKNSSLADCNQVNAVYTLNKEYNKKEELINMLIN